MDTNDQFNNYIVLAESELQAILDSSENNSEVLSLLASSYGEQIVVNNHSAKILAPRALLIMSKAIDVDPENPRVQLLAGKLSLTLPENFGGDKEKSLIHLKRSVELFESNQDSYDDIDWGYIYSLAWLGKNYVELNDFSTAIDIYNKALEVEPDFVWIKNILLPEASDKLDENNK